MLLYRFFWSSDVDPISASYWHWGWQCARGGTRRIGWALGRWGPSVCVRVVGISMRINKYGFKRKFFPTIPSSKVVNSKDTTPGETKQ